MSEDEKWMYIAIQEAINAEKQSEVPVGAIIVKNNSIISRAHNQPISTNDPTAHAEIQAIRLAGKRQQNYRLVDTTLYVTLEPCLMCIGAIMHARINRVVFGAFDVRNGLNNSNIDSEIREFLNRKIEVNGGVLETECKKLLQSFFKYRRK